MIAAFFQALYMHWLRVRSLYVVLIVFLILAGVSIVCLTSAPSRTYPASVTIPAGTSLTGSAAILEENGLLRSRRAYRAIALIEHVRGIQAGTYYFAHAPTVWELVSRLEKGDIGRAEVHITFPEGTPVRQMGDMLRASFPPSFDAEHFKSIALPYEGFLFPDTYYFDPEVTPEEVLARMRANFDTHAEWMQGKPLSEKEERDAVILASILEAEGKTLEDKRIIAGILLKRMASGMPLQVDAAFGYIYGRTGYTPTAADLKSNSAYNTYRMKGLPPTPINNPGEESLRAAVTPTMSPYLYYLTGTDGTMHYSKTFAEHVANKKKYLQ